MESNGIQWNRVQSNAIQCSPMQSNAIQSHAMQSNESNPVLSSGMQSLECRALRAEPPPSTVAVTLPQLLVHICGHQGLLEAATLMLG